MFHIKQNIILSQNYSFAIGFKRFIYKLYLTTFRDISYKEIKMTQYCSYKRWIELKNLSYENKLLWSQQLILNAIKNSKTGFSVSLSWGKDSVMMSHLIKSICKKGKYIFANTGIEYPETYKYRDLMLKTEFKDIEYYETKPIKSFNQCVKEYGYPHFRMTAEQDSKKRTPMCCVFLKERPLNNKQKELGVDTVFMGLLGSESMNR